MSASIQPALLADALVKTYPSGRGAPPVRALDGLSLSIAAGTVFGLLGPNGAGKSTAVKILTTLSRADSGTAVVAGHDVLRQPAAVRHSIGLVSQKSSGDPMATGRENLVLAGRIQGLSRREAAVRAAELLDRFGLDDAGNRLAKTYSGGMARKLDVAIGLVHAPSLLFLDEPSTGLDPQNRANLWDHIARMRTEHGMTIVLTTHYMDEADTMAERVVVHVSVTGSPLLRSVWSIVNVKVGGEAVVAGLLRTGAQSTTTAAMVSLSQRR